MSASVVDHIDLRVKNFDGVLAFYDALMPAIGLSQKSKGKEFITYDAAKNDVGFFGMTQEPRHVPNGTRIAFRASSPADVDRIAAIIERAGGRAIEGPGLCPEYTPTYYAVFFEDPEGNKLEVCYHEE